ncbi:Nitrogen fixation protein FixI [uncultured Gammaproteobacteria bacterium]
MTVCAHCGQAVAASPEERAGSDGGSEAESVRFCCPGCAGAYHLVRGLGLGSYYLRRTLDPATRPLRPDPDQAVINYAAHGVADGEGRGTSALHLMVDGLHCGACVWLIESVLARQPGVVKARLNMTSRRLTLVWRDDEAEANVLVAAVTALGYRLVPFDPLRLSQSERRNEIQLLRAMAVAGFGAANVMMISVGVWAGHSEGMGPDTRTLMHWISALIALPAIAYAIQPFLRSAWSALANLRTNMDVPISIGVTLATAMSLFETMRGGPHAYFDGAISLLFFLLIGRYLDLRARGRARSNAEHLLALAATSVTLIGADGRAEMVPPEQVRPGMVVLVATGERIPVDGVIRDGAADLATSLITGESLPTAATPGERVFAGTLNLTAPLRLEVVAVGEDTLLAEIVRLMEAAEQGRSRYIKLADRVSRLYAPVVHLAALSTFLGWVWIMGAAWQDALVIAIAVLIITCPCALALAVPVVQVVACGRLLRQGILIKSATALERLAKVDTVVFDKTGTLTEGRPEWLRGLGTGAGEAEANLVVAASLAQASKHPLARALVRAAPLSPVVAGVREIPGSGLVLDTPKGEIRLGHRRFCAVPESLATTVHESPTTTANDGGESLELWLARPGQPPVCFNFSDQAREDAVAVVDDLRRAGLRLAILSGDREPVVATLARRLGIAEWRAAQSPTDKTTALAGLAAEGAKVLMVGDGLNDAPALAAALVSMSPSTAVDVSQTAADVVFQGRRLAPTLETLMVARRADLLVRQNLALSIAYNVFTVPLAMMGMVTPLIAAVAMSSSSVLVILNALRLNQNLKSHRGTAATTAATTAKELGDERNTAPDRRRPDPGCARSGRVPVGG